MQSESFPREQSYSYMVCGFHGVIYED